jgi:hypothetical protein
VFLKASLAARVHEYPDGRIVLSMGGGKAAREVPSLDVAKRVLRLEQYQVFTCVGTLWGALNIGVPALAIGIAIWSLLFLSRRRIVSDLLVSSRPLEQGESALRYMANLPGWLPWLVLVLGWVPGLFGGVAYLLVSNGGTPASAEPSVYAVVIGVLFTAAAVALHFARKRANHSLNPDGADAPRD